MGNGPARLRQWAAEDGAWYLAQAGDPDIRLPQHSRRSHISRRPGVMQMSPLTAAM